MDVISIGPIALSVERFIAVVSIGVFLISAWLIGKRHEDLRGWETGVLVAGLVGSRLWYVLLHLSVYSVRPATALFFWQGGFSILGAVIGSAGWTIWRFRRRLALVPRALLPICLGLAVWAVPTGIRSLSDAPRPTLPSLTLPLLEGGEIDLGSFPDTPVVVNIWATWCPPCRREMPMLAEVARTRGEVLFLFANQGEGSTTVEDYIAERGLEISNVILDSASQLSRHFGARALPTTLFFDRDGTLVDAHIGEISQAALIDSIKELRDPE